MGDTNYIGGVIKILEPPKQKLIKNNLFVTRFRAQIPQLRNTRIINVTFWGNLARDVATYYKVNDYLLVEGYLSLRNKKNSNLSGSPSKKVELTVLKVYPFLLTSNRSLTKT